MNWNETSPADSCCFLEKKTSLDAISLVKQKHEKKKHEEQTGSSSHCSEDEDHPRPSKTQFRWTCPTKILETTIDILQKLRKYIIIQYVCHLMGYWCMEYNRHIIEHIIIQYIQEPYFALDIDVWNMMEPSKTMKLGRNAPFHRRVFVQHPVHVLRRADPQPPPCNKVYGSSMCFFLRTHLIQPHSSIETYIYIYIFYIIYIYTWLYILYILYIYIYTRMLLNIIKLY